ncbi:MAG: hypothetical protein ACUVSE_12830, partial [Armatimonadota bacterium]
MIRRAIDILARENLVVRSPRCRPLVRCSRSTRPPPFQRSSIISASLPVCP